MCCCLIDENVLLEIQKEYKIPFSISNLENIRTIIDKTGLDTVADFKIVVDYLKDRATRDEYNRPIKQEAIDEGAKYPNWLFYFHEYAFYLKEVIGGNGINWMNTKRYLFPNDVYDITYKYHNERNIVFLKCLEDKTDSLGFKIIDECYGENWGLTENTQVIYEIMYTPYCDWEETERVGIFVEKNKANEQCENLNKLYWNNRNPYYVVETIVNCLKLNNAFYDGGNDR